MRDEKQKNIKLPFAKDKTGPSLAWPTIFVPEHELNCQPAILYLPLSLAEVLKRFE